MFSCEMSREKENATRTLLLFDSHPTSSAEHTRVGVGWVVCPEKEQHTDGPLLALIWVLQGSMERPGICLDRHPHRRAPDTTVVGYLYTV